MRTSLAILNKQCRDSLRNLPTLMIIIIYPAVAFIMISAMGRQEGASEMFLSMFATMHCCFAPASIASNILSEEKEKGTLRSLLMAGVDRVNYLVSIGLFVIVAVMLTGGTFLLMAPFDGQDVLTFLSAMLGGTVISTILGLCIGIHSQNVAAANGLAVPVGLTLTLLPMLAQFNDRLAKVSRLLYSGQISLLLRGAQPSVGEAAAVMGGELLILSAVLIWIFKKKAE